MNRKLLWLIFILLVGVGVTLKFSTSHESMPIGCDEFGYLNQAKAMNQGITFQSHVARPYLVELLDTLRRSGITEYEIAWMITPHAYHLIPGTERIINQYPPGTAFMLHFIPVQFRKVLFPFFVLLIFIILPLISIKNSNSNKLTWFELVFALVIFIITVSAPFLTELTRVNSVAPTFGLLIAAGILLKRYPLWSCFLIALSVNFRMANLLMVLPVFLFTQLTFGKMISVRNVVQFSIVTLVAILPLLIYNYLVTGNAFASTYSSIDKTFSDFQALGESSEFYFSLSQYWLRVHILVIMGIVLVAIIRGSKLNEFWKVLMFPVFNYAFFVFHAVHMDYYPYASALILLGVALEMLTVFEISERFRKITYVGVLAVSLIILLSGANRFMKRKHTSFLEAKAKYQSLCAYNIVWADLYSGTSEYVCDNNGFRYGTTTPRARKLAMKYLSTRKYSQVVLLDDNTVDSKIILQEIEEAGLSYKLQSNSNVGNFIVID